MYTALSLAQRLVDWLNGSSYSPGHPISDPEDREALQLGTLLDTVAALDDTTAGRGTDLIGVYDEHSVFTGTNLTDVLYELYQAATSAGSDSFTDTGNFYATDTVGAAFVALGTALGGTNSTTRNYTGGTGTRLIDNDSFFTALDKLDQGFVDLASVANAKGAALVGVEDAANFYAGATVETVLANIATALGGTNNATRPYTMNAVVADNDSFYTAVEKFDTRFGQFVRGTMIINNGTNNANVAVGAQYNGKQVIATMNEADGTLAVSSAIVAGGNLTITLTGNTTGVRDIAYLILGW